MREDLLGYLLGALSADEQRHIDDALAVDPQLRRELEQIRRSLAPLDALDDDQDPPSGLADRSLQAIERYEESCRPTPRSRAHANAVPCDAAPLDRSVVRTHLYSISDGIVLALVGLTAITLFLPALASSRFESRKGACQNNLREIGSLLIEDSMRNGGGKFIPVPMSGKQAFGGIFATTLFERQMLAVNTTALLCPGIEWRSDLRPWFVPTLEQINNSSDAELHRYQLMAGGSYAYNIGYRDSRGRVCAIRNQSRSSFPILADVPSFHLANRQSANHGGRGQNIYYEDGHITFYARLKQIVEDDPIRNRLGDVEYGLDADDAVLLPSHMPPIVLQAEPAPTVVLEPLNVAPHAVR